MSSLGSPAAHRPPPVISRGSSTSSAARLNSCGAPSASPAAAPRSVPVKRAFSSTCCCVIAFGCFSRIFGSGLIGPMWPPSLLLAAQLRLDEVQPVVAPEAAFADEDRGNAEDTARQGQV